MTYFVQCIQCQTLLCETGLMSRPNQRIELYHHLLGKQRVVVELQQQTRERGQQRRNMEKLGVPWQWETRGFCCCYIV